MERAQAAAQRALEAAVEMCVDSGLADAWRTLVQDVYMSNLDRYEPEELGDTVMSFGVQCYENLRVRAIRRYQHDDLEHPDAHWNIEGLRVGVPGNVLTFELAGASFVTMKVPYAERRIPNWDREGDWDQDSQIRSKIAAENSKVLQYRTDAAAALPLFPHPGSPGTVQKFMLLWGGESDVAMTAGWLAVPTLGYKPFIAHEKLWWDTEPDTRIRQKLMPDRGPSFDERPAAKPAVTLKKKTQEEQA